MIRAIHNHYLWGLFIPLVMLVNLGGCSSLATDATTRDKIITAYLAQPEHLVLYSGSELLVDEQLQALGLENLVTPIAERFNSAQATRGIVGQFIAATPLAHRPVKLVAADEWHTLHLDPQTPVLFLHANWKMSYQRLPPSFRANRLQATVIAKIIPLGQVLAGKGTVALHTAAWQARCQFEPLDGRYLAREEWLADDAMKLQQAITASQQVCGARLAATFPTTPVVGTRPEAGYN